MFWFPELLARERADACRQLLDETFAGRMRRAHLPIPARSIRELRRNYEEVLPKTLSNYSVVLSKRSRATAIAKTVGLLGMLQSPSLHALAEQLCGYQLDTLPSCQLIYYGPGDFVGPHNDHHPECPKFRHGYVDVHLTLSSPCVEHQWLVYEERHLLQRVVAVAMPSGLSVCLLPFWHYTTPLVARADGAGDARRWLLLASYSIRPGRRTRFARFGGASPSRVGSAIRSEGRVRAR